MDLTLAERTEAEIRAQDLRVSYGKTVALHIPKLSIRGKIIAVIGHNGSGKSTFLKTLLELLAPKKGVLHSYWQGSAEPYRLVPERHMAFSPENGAVFEDVSVESYVKLWCRIKHGDASFYRTKGSRHIEQLQIAPLFSRLGRELSKGQRRRVMAAVGFLINPRLFLFDEPFDGLDIMQSNELANVMIAESDRIAMVVSSHRMDVVERIADMVLVLRDGQVHAFGSVEEVCATLCGGSVMISAVNGEAAALERVLSDLRREFYSCLIHQIGRQVLVTGADARTDSLEEFFARVQLCGLRIDPVRPSLMDAMRYHLNRLH